MSEDLEHEPLCVRNRLVYPNAEPVTGERVKLTMVVYEGWRTEPSEGRVVGTSYAWTDDDGIWTTRLLPYTAFEPDLQDSVYVQVESRSTTSSPSGGSCRSVKTCRSWSCRSARSPSGTAGTPATSPSATRTEATPWVLEFGLADPAYLREVWGAGSPRYEELTGGRWRIWSDTPIPAGTDARVGVRVEPSGQPRGPQGMTVRKGRM